MQYIQYFLYVIGFLTFCYGVATLRLQRGLQDKKTFWVKLDNVRAQKEVHEYAMHQSSLAISGLIYISAAILIGALAFSISFPDYLLENVQNVRSSDILKNAIFGAQLLTLMTLLFIPCLIITLIFLDKLELESKIKNALTMLLILACVAATFVVLYIAFTYLMPALAHLNELVEPLFTNAFNGKWAKLATPFATTTLLLAYPSLIIMGAIALGANALGSAGLPKDILPKGADIEKHTLAFVDKTLVFTIGFIGSVFYTLASGAIGSSLGEAVTSGVSMQLVVVNAIFDGLTLYVTASLLKWASASWRCRAKISQLELDIKSMLGSNVTYFCREPESPFQFKEEYGERINSVAVADDNSSKIHFGQHPYKPISIDILSELGQLFGFKDTITFDRVLFRNVVEEDGDVNLYSKGNGSDAIQEYDQEKSWMISALKHLKLDLKTHINNEPSNTPESVNYTQLDGFMKSTWDCIDKNRYMFKSRPFFAVIGDLLLAAVFAYSSIFFGLMGSGNELSFPQLTRLFFGGFDGTGFTEIGPLFWVMHTTFIPSAVLWGILVALMISAFLISPLFNWAAQKFGNGEKSDLPPEIMAQLSVSKTGGFLMSLGTIIGIVRWLFE